MKPLCAQCPISAHNSKPVRPKVKRRSIAIVGEAPGQQEEAEGDFFVGASGFYLNKGLSLAGKTRNDCQINNACLCRPKRELRPDEWKKAIAACKPRLEADLKGAEFILTVGKRAFHSLTPYRDALFPWVGAPQEFDGRTIVPSMHPAFCLRGNRQYLPVFYTFIQRIFDLHDKEHVFNWQPLSYYGHGDALATLRELADPSFYAGPRWLGIDIETAGRDPLTSDITALGLADKYRGVSILWPPERHFENRKDAREAKRFIREILNSNVLKVCHNGAHDITGLRRVGFRVKNYIHDTLLMHHVAGNLLKHDLGFVSQVEFACDPWKKMFKVTGDAKGLKRFLTAKGEELTLYNAKDTAILPLLVPKLLARVRSEFRGMELYEGYFKRSEIAARMRARGLVKNREAILKHRRSLGPKIGKAQKAVEKISRRVEKFNSWGPKKDKPFNIAALGHLRTLFFDHLKQTPLRFTEKTRVGKLDANTLKGLCVSSNSVVREAARQLLVYRVNTKLRNTYLNPLLSPEKTVHPTPKVWGTKTGRWAYNDPAINTAPPGLRDCFKAPKGRWIVEADYSQLELRIVALLAQDEELLNWYSQGIDVHYRNAQGLFETEKPSSDQRDLAKRFVYGCNYGGQAGTIWASLAPRFPALTLTTVSRMMAKWKAQRKPIARWQKELLLKARKDDFVEAPLSGRREYFHGQPELTKILNYPIQATAADIIDSALPHVWYSLRQIQSFLLIQVHDSLIAETPYPKECAKRMQRWMSKSVSLGGMKCKFPVDFKIARGWGDQKKYASWEKIPKRIR